MAQPCKALILRCIDFRLTKPVKKYLEDNQLLGDCDIVAAGGGPKNLADPIKPTDKDFILRQIGRSKELHNIKQVILLNHTDCGGYGTSEAFDNEETESTRLKADLETASKIVEQVHADLEVTKLFAEIKPKEEVEIINL